tara:strand:- start:47128 stop:47979 length:852 start_codon:yes stop_codon:yes gene_type:complete
LNTLLNFSLVVLLSLILSWKSKAQENLYFDETSTQINKAEFTKKCNSSYIYKCISYPTDTLVINKVFFKYKFGKISPEKFQQIRKLLIKDGKYKIEKNQIIIIKKFDSLYNYEREIEYHKIHEKNYKKYKAINDSLGYEKYHIHQHDFNKKIFQKSLNSWIREKQKCIAKFEKKFHTKVIYLHEDDIEQEENYNNFSWVKDRGIIKRIFFSDNNVHDLLILKPNGEYLLSGGHFIDRYLKKILQNQDWSQFKEDWIKSLEADNPHGKGIFKERRSIYHKKHCF